MELYDRVAHGRPLSKHSRTVLWLTVGLYVAGTFLLLAARRSFWQDLPGAWREGFGSTTGVATGEEGEPAYPHLDALREALVSSAAGSINSRTLGLPLEYANVLPRIAQCLLIALMAVGASPAGTGGGLKPTCLVQLFRGARDALAGRAVPRAFGVAAAWLGAYGGIVAIGFLCLLWQVPQMSPDQLLFLSVSAASNVGLSHDLLSLVVGPLFTLSAVMLLGRVVPLLVLWWMAETTTNADLLVA